MITQSPPRCEGCPATYVRDVLQERTNEIGRPSPQNYVDCLRTTAGCSQLGEPWAPTADMRSPEPWVRKTLGSQNR